MPEDQPASQLAAMVGKWCDLALKRRAHFAELHDSGRWRHYYTESEFVAELRKLADMLDRWKGIASDAAECAGTSRAEATRDAPFVTRPDSRPGNLSTAA